MLSRINSDLNLILFTMKHYMEFTLGVVGLLIGIHIINTVLGMRLNYLGIYPRKAHGLIGIICSPFLHGDFNHVFFNCFPLFALMNMILIDGWQVFVYVNLTVIFLAGFAVWLLGRPAYHIGASTVIMGYFGFILIQSIISPSLISIIALLVCLIYFGGLVVSLIPEKGVSWEGHAFGFCSGILSYYVCLYLLR